ncbi:MAG: carbohydrate kinase [Candidatus Schekmanbacteria bacterium]|nr:carbohydrate kinase [Candidatus Schekmanbacteria bacterium]
MDSSCGPLVFGEALYDSFPDGSAVLGGAPFNVAWHLQGFGLAPLFITRVGRDELGERMIAAMRAWGMDTRGVQTDPRHPTGSVAVSFRGHEPSFSIVPEQAYDFIDGELAAALMQDGSPGLLYHGSLIARHSASRDALARLRSAGLSVFLDVNLRAPWWQRPWLDDALRSARWGKVNEHELRVLAAPDATGDDGDDGDDDVSARGQRLRREYGLELLVVTRGAAGALLLTAAGATAAAPHDTAAIVDTVGAGDAFSAVTILGLLRGWSLPQMAVRAVELAGAVCRMRGATGHDRALYQKHLLRWAT